MAPTIFIVPGIYEGTEAFEPLVKALKNLGHDKTVVSGLRSTGTSSKPGPGIKARDDVESIAKDMARAVEDAGDDGVVGLFHSAGGWIGSAATKGLTAQERKAAGQTGGVKKILFLASALFGGGNSNSSGSDTNSKGPILMPFMEKNEEKGIQSCKTPEHFLFHDLPPQEAASWTAKIKHQPLYYFDDYTPHQGWEGVPNVWFITEKDRMLPVPVQVKCAEKAQGKQVRLDVGHVPMLSMTDEFAKLVLENIN
ncbi:alpha/beta-hydrolase [Sarocladium strictum]